MLNKAPLQVLLLSFVVGVVSAQDLPLEQRIKIGTDALKLGCGMERAEHSVDVQIGADGSVTLRKLPGLSANGQVHYSSKEAVGLIAAFQQQINAEGARLSDKQLDCMRTYVDRIVNAVLSPQDSDQTKAEKRQVCLETCDYGRDACQSDQRQQYDRCIEDRRQYCPGSCTDKYHIPMAECISDYCNVDTGSNKINWPAKCHARQDPADCENSRVSCRQTCLQ